MFLQQMHRIPIQRKNLASLVSKIEVCTPQTDKDKQKTQQLLKPPNDIQDTKKWQYGVSVEDTVTKSLSEHYVFSAYYDRRWDPPVVLMIGLGSNYEKGNPLLYCRMWFIDDEKPLTVKAHFRFVPETHGQK